MSYETSNNILRPEGANYKIWEEGIDFNLTPEVGAKINELVKEEANYLGRGGSGVVFNLGEQCIKIMINRHDNPDPRMDLGNSVEEEFAIQKFLSSFLQVDNVYCPQPFICLKDEKYTAIIMERVDGANMQMVLNGKEKMPANFDLNKFFNALEEYVEGMHDLGVAHADLAPRNIMVDRKTGMPIVIDFGRSRNLKNGDISEEKACKFKKADFDLVDACYEAVEGRLDKLKK
jgi:tRNA A-37 threonylcarbamoyl transferase component Bud32